MNKLLLTATLAIIGGAAIAAPGFVKAVFSGSAYNGTSDIWSYTKATVVENLDEIYDVRSDFPETTTYAYGTYMQLEGGVEYYFGGTFDDYVSVKIDEVTVIPQGGSCGSIAYGVIKFEQTGWHKFDFRVANNSGPGGNRDNWYLGGIYMARLGNGFSKIVNNADGIRCVTEAPEGYAPVVPEYAFSFSTYTSNSKTYVRLNKCGGCTVELNIPETVLGYPVGQIDDSCFNGNTTLKTITHWPSQLMTIGGGAFYGCTALESVEVPDTVTSLGGSAFRCCSALKTAKLPKDYTRTADALFMDCSSLESVTMPDAPTRIDDHTFRNCSKLKSIVVADTVGYIGAYAFYGCSSLPDVNIPDGVYTIGEHAFCNVLFSKVVIPNAVQSIGVAAFQSCPNLADVVLPVNLTTIPNYMLAQTKIKTIAIPDTVTSIGEGAFNSCSELESLVIPDSVNTMGSKIFSNCSALSNVKLPSDITAIPAYAFNFCTSLTKIHLPDTVATICYDAFDGCTALAEINFPDSLRLIDRNAFRNCSSLVMLTFPAEFEEFINDSYGADDEDRYNYHNYPVFNNCSGLQNVVFNGPPPKRVQYTGLQNYHCVFPKEYGSKWIQAIGINSFTGYSTGSILTMNVISSSIRESDPTIMDVVYKVTSKKPTVKVRVLAFEDGERSFAKVVRPETFVTDTNGVETACNVGDNVTPNVEHTISWRVSSDWQTKLAKVKFEVLACEGELLPLELMTIPASDQYGKMKISWNAISDSQLFDALLWQCACKDSALTFGDTYLRVNGVDVARNDSFANNTERERAADYIYGKMGYSRLIGAPLTYANSEARLGLSPSGARQYAYKIVEK